MAQGIELSALAQDGHARVELWRLQVGHQPGGEALAQARLEVVVVDRRAVACEHELPAAFVEGVERVEELFLGLDLVGKELNVVQEQHVDAAEAVPEAGRVALLD